MPPNGPESQEGLTRRQALGLGLATAAGVAVGTITIKDLLTNPSDRKSADEIYPIEGGEIVDDQQLVELLNEAQRLKKPVTADPTILKSTVYSTMRYHGLSEELALDTSERIYIERLTHQDGYAGLDENGFFVVLNEANFEDAQSGHNIATRDWPSLIHLTGHEATHVSAYATSEDMVENYGPLGKAHLTGAVHGFGANQEAYDGAFNFIRPRVIGGELPNTIEEWTAEAGRIEFIRYLGEKGLSDEYTKSVETSRLQCRCHAFLEPSIRQVYDSGQPEDLGSSFTPAWLLAQHRETRRGAAFLGIGEGILGQNPLTDIRGIGESSIRGLGMLGFSAFVYERGVRTPGTLESLQSGEIDDQTLLKLAREHQQFLDKMYGVQTIVIGQ